MKKSKIQNNLGQGLNPQQQEAVKYTDGPLLILAGAGTGKTTVIIEKITYLIDSFFAQPNEILAVTFTNKAANEMRHRIASKIGEIEKNIWIGTFHSIALRILRRHAAEVFDSINFNVIDAEDQFKILKKTAIDAGVDLKDYPIKNYQYQIERLKDKALLPEDISYKNEYNLPEFTKIYTQYQNQLRRNNFVDFGDILLYNIKIFQKNPEIAKYYQNKFSYILVDEYQDTNRAQYQWLLHITNKKQYICCVGDDDQSIYSWRGAEIANILKLKKDFPKAKIIKLEENYRSTKNILQIASKIIKENHERHDKTLWTNGDQGSEVVLKSFSSDKKEAQGIANIIKNIDSDFRNIAILFRAGYQTRIFEEVFINSSIPYQIIGGLRFYERKEIKDAISYLRISLNPNNNLAFERIINLPRRGVGKVAMDNLLQISSNQNCSLFEAVKFEIEKGKVKRPLKDLLMQINLWQQALKNDYNLANLAQNILTDCGYFQMWKAQKTPEAQSRAENLQEFINSLKDFENLEQFLEHVSLVSDNENKQNQTSMVNLMTVHAAKGLEFENVFIPGLEEGIFPNSKAMFEEKSIEEERRLLYVAVTRAKKNLFLSFARGRFKYGSWENSISSRFIKDIVISGDNFLTNEFEE
jgi:DNA helicase-2/ATP-dependent DNA helicase PcrA